MKTQKNKGQEYFIFPSPSSTSQRKSACQDNWISSCLQTYLFLLHIKASAFQNSRKTKLFYPTSTALFFLVKIHWFYSTIRQPYVLEKCKPVPSSKGNCTHLDVCREGGAREGESGDNVLWAHVWAPGKSQAGMPVRRLLCFLSQDVFKGLTWPS